MSIVLDLYNQLIQRNFYSHVSTDELHTEVPLLSTSVSQVKLNGIVYHRNEAVTKLLPSNYGSLILVSNGDGWWLTEHTIQAATNAQLVYIEANQQHVFHLPEHYHAISFNFPIDWLTTRTGQLLQHGQSVTATPQLARLLMQVLSKPVLTKTHAKWFEDDIALQLLICFHPPLISSPLHDLQQLITKHANNEAFCIDMLCDYSGWSKRYIFKLFASTDLSANEYLIRERLRQAYFELLSAPKSLNQVAINSGFKSQAHFSRRFRQLFSLAPKQIVQRVHS
ncbi:helix-turn-helix transcriptional regulator [Pseudoalteromonas piscicida]|uniref:helix-turn-helix transcriptional regulator n=1 Tax=Pseudoalteromonas piscicida TaxID=43662 RepID=UPI00309D2DC4